MGHDQPSVDSIRIHHEPLNQKKTEHNHLCQRCSGCTISPHKKSKQPSASCLKPSECKWMMVIGDIPFSAFLVEFGSKNTPKPIIWKSAVVWTSQEEVLQQTGIVSYIHKDWYENHLSIYQHYRSEHAGLLHSIMIEQWSNSSGHHTCQRCRDPSCSQCEKDGAAQFSAELW